MKVDKIDVSSLRDLRLFCEKLCSELRAKTLVLLSGEMGAGKTQTTKYIVEALGGSDVSSPTFALHNTYITPTLAVEHFDLYRLESDDDLMRAGFWESFEAEKGIVIVEWADRLAGDDWIPKDWDIVRIRIEVDSSSLSDGGRYLFLSR